MFLAWSSIVQSVCELAFSLLANWCLETSQLRIPHSAEEDNLSPFDSKIACLCQSIEINNNKHVYCQNQVWQPIGSEVKWAECSLIIGMGCWVKVFSLILNSAVGLWLGIQSADELVSGTYQLRILHSAEEDNLSPSNSKITCLCQSIVLLHLNPEVHLYNFLYVSAWILCQLTERLSQPCFVVPLTLVLPNSY